jgi:Tfp pilus assembly PilM family ATPase
VWRALDVALKTSSGLVGVGAACLLPKHCCGLQFARLMDGRDRRHAVSDYLKSVHINKIEHSWDFWQWDATGQGEDAEDTAIMLVARELAESTGKRLRTMRLHCRALDGLPTSLARAAKLGTTNFPAGPYAALDWGAGEASFVLIANGAPVFVRTLRDCGLGQTLKAIRETLCLTEPEANAILQGVESSFPQDLDHEIRRVMSELWAPAFDAVTEEISRTLDYLRSHRRFILPTGLLLFGMGSTIRNIAAQIESKVSIPTEVWKPRHIVDARSDRSVPLQLLGPAIALSLLAWEPK